MKKTSLLIVDDDPAAIEKLTHILNSIGYEDIEATENANDAGLILRSDLSEKKFSSSTAFQAPFQVDDCCAPTTGLGRCGLERCHHRALSQNAMHSIFQESAPLPVNNTYREDTRFNTSGEVIEKKVWNLPGLEGMKIQNIGNRKFYRFH
jgi:hypothetical protein